MHAAFRGGRPCGTSQRPVHSAARSSRAWPTGPADDSSLLIYLRHHRALKLSCSEAEAARGESIPGKLRGNAAFLEWLPRREDRSITSSSSSTDLGDSLRKHGLVREAAGFSQHSKAVGFGLECHFVLGRLFGWRGWGGSTGNAESRLEPMGRTMVRMVRDAAWEEVLLPNIEELTWGKSPDILSNYAQGARRSLVTTTTQAIL